MVAAAAQSKPRCRPIVMSGESIAAMRDKRKTQTRRLLKKQPKQYNAITPLWGTSPGPDAVDFGERYLWTESGPDYPDDASDERRCPFGVPGDLLWVRETWSGGITIGAFEYRADYCAENEVDFRKRGLRWKPPMYMPRGASRWLLRLTDVRAQQLQDITTADIIAEGIQYPVTSQDCPPGKVYPLMHLTGKFPPYEYVGKGAAWTHDNMMRAYFASAWNTLNAKRGHPWKKNDYVWALTFEIVEGP